MFAQFTSFQVRKPVKHLLWVGGAGEGGGAGIQLSFQTRRLQNYEMNWFWWFNESKCMNIHIQGGVGGNNLLFGDFFFFLLLYN